MTKVVISFDTELSLALHQRGMAPRANFESSILGRCAKGDCGIGWQMSVLEDHGLKGVFFVDPFPALVYDNAVIADTVKMILDRGHDVQLHIHTEWLKWTKSSPVAPRTGTSLCDFMLADQRVLLALAKQLLIEAGAPAPTAFRAGNFGADDNSLIALEELGFKWDSSFNAAFSGKPCRIGLVPQQVHPLDWLGLTELPISGLEDSPGQFRPAQVCALSAWEMTAALDHAAQNDHPLFSIVCHSFEMLSRDRQRPNRQVMRRFEALCAHIARHPGLETITFATLDRAIVRPKEPQPARLGASHLRTGFRMAEQLVGSLLYERALRPA